MTFGEITIQIEAKNELMEFETKNKVIENYNLASLITLFIGNSFNGKTNPSLQELYPDLFGSIDNSKQQQDLEYQKAMLYKEQMMDFAMAHNKRRHQE